MGINLVADAAALKHCCIMGNTTCPLNAKFATFWHFSHFNDNLTI
jgi:hypothetical protein